MSNTELLEQYRAFRRESDPKMLKMVNSSMLFNMYLLTQLPMGLVAGMKVKSATPEKCEVTVPYRWMNQNPFRSTYFAVLSMAAELSTGLLGMLATKDSKPSVSMLVTNFEGKFVKKAIGITTFTCDQGAEITRTIEEAIITGEGKDFKALSIGRSENGEIESEFNVQWSFKMRSPKK